MVAPISGSNPAKSPFLAPTNLAPKVGSAAARKHATPKAKAPPADTATFSQQALQAAKNPALERSKAHEATESAIVETRETKQQGLSQLQSLISGGK